MSERKLIILEGIRITGLQPEALRGLDLALDVFQDVDEDCVLTSGRGGRHGRHSHHYKGLAFDLRSKHLSAELKEQVLAALIAYLGSDYQIFLEGLGEIWEHFHIEYDPLHKIEYMT